MGFYDLRCALSGLSLHGAMGPGRHRTAALLVGEVDGRWVPLLPPVGGHYDRYGRVELWGDDPAEAIHAAWVGAVLELLWQAGALRSDAPRKLASHMASGEFGGGAGPFLAHVAESVQDGHGVYIGAVRVRPCFYREDVAAEIAADASLASAEPARLPLLDDFAPLPPETTATIKDLGRVLRWSERHGGLRPVGVDDGNQHFFTDFDRFAREAYQRDPILRRLLSRWHREDMAALADRREFFEPPYRPTSPFDLNDLEPVLAADGVPPAEREALIAAVVAASDPHQVARILGAERSPDAAILAEFAGTIALRGDRMHLHHATIAECSATYLIGERRPRVRDGDSVAVGERLSDGDEDPHELLRIFGAAHVLDRLSALLGGLLGLTAAQAGTLIAPMLRHATVCDTGERVSLARWQAWFEAGQLDDLRAELALTGYPALRVHVDPPLAAIEAAQERRHRLAHRLEDPDRYYLPRDLCGCDAPDSRDTSGA